MKKNNKLDIIYEDKDIIVINKPSHLLTISTENEKEKTLFHEVMMYLKKKNKNNKVFIVHRLDKDTSGLVLFAKSQELKNKLQKDWDKAIRHYVCVVNKPLEKKKGTIKSYLMETKTLFVYSTNDSKLGKLAITDYEEISSNKKLSLVNINLKTGRKNQIRVHMNDIGNQIVGDKKYGSIKFDPLRRLCLHANYLEIIHPITKRKMVFETKIPVEFCNLIDTIK